MGNAVTGSLFKGGSYSVPYEVSWSISQHVRAHLTLSPLYNPLSANSFWNVTMQIWKQFFTEKEATVLPAVAEGGKHHGTVTQRYLLVSWLQGAGVNAPSDDAASGV